MALVIQITHTFPHFLQLSVTRDYEMHHTVSRVKGLLAALHSSQRSNERPLFTPSRDPASLSAEWDVLEVAEQEYWGAIRSLHAAFVEYDHACASFNANHETVTSWLQECRSMFDDTEIGGEGEGASKYASEHPVPG